jgi:hypothetical protein
MNLHRKRVERVALGVNTIGMREQQIPPLRYGMTTKGVDDDGTDSDTGVGIE